MEDSPPPFFVVVHTLFLRREPGLLIHLSARLVIKRLRVRIPARAAEEYSSPESTLCANSYSVSVPPPCYSSGM